MTLAEILKVKGGNVYTIGPEAALDHVVEELVRHNIGSLVVCERDMESGERLVGIITERDILHASAAGKRSLAEVKVGDVMSTKLVTASPKDPVDAVMGLMTSRRVRHMPVLSEGRLVGMVSIGDVVKAQHDRLAMENSFMKDYIRST